MAIVKEVRERIRKKDEPEQVPKGGKAPAKAPPAKGKEDPKAKKAAPAQPQPEDIEPKRQLPSPSAHVNNDIREFLLHFKSDRLIHITCDKSTQARKRTD